MRSLDEPLASERVRACVPGKSFGLNGIKVLPGAIHADWVGYRGGEGGVASGVSVSSVLPT